MYDFYLGTKREIADNEEQYLLSIKRMLPRWLNSIPDSEYIAIHRLLKEHCEKDTVVVAETGIGASTIVLLHHAMKHNGTLYSWDLANPKGAELRSVCNDTLAVYHKTAAWDHWKFVPYNSLSPDLGIPILKEFEATVDFCFCDSDHTWDHLRQELSLFSAFLKQGSIVSIDDANYICKHTNMAYINMFRTKLGLPGRDDPADNVCEPFADGTEALLNEHFSEVTRLSTYYPSHCRDDMFFSYFSNDRTIMDSAGMEKLDQLEQRFQAWMVQ